MDQRMAESRAAIPRSQELLEMKEILLTNRWPASDDRGAAMRFFLARKEALPEHTYCQWAFNILVAATPQVGPTEMALRLNRCAEHIAQEKLPGLERVGDYVDLWQKEHDGEIV